MTEGDEGIEGSTSATRVEARVVLRPLASPLPLGLLSFAIGMVLVAGISLGWVVDGDVAVAGLVLAVFVFPLEGLSAVLAFFARDVGVATVLGLFSTSWVATGLVSWLHPSSSGSTALGLFLLSFGVVLLGPLVAAAPARPLLAVTLAVSVVRALLGGVAELTGSQGWSHAEGVAALVLAVVAVYNGTALLLEDARQEALLPTVRRGLASQALRGDLEAQVGRSAREAGVRQLL